ncbi:taste receptor type 2 member 4-like [Hyla sarda]|uniref:taste receptor type 2 member 4-like n=1 Tax=Hyla sarda TaxID=327740 RepID=UPI0024C38BD4|nr:taste receptor type 2 member 4-like [Hyla sarda]
MSIDDWNDLGQVIALILEVTAGVLFNIFIISIIFYDFYREKNMGSSNKILVSLCISNVIYNILVFAGLLDEFVDLRVPSTFCLSSVYIVLLFFSVSSCAWLTASLGTFYFIKISQVGLLGWVKIHISSIVPWMLLVLEVVSFINSFFSSFLLISYPTSSRNVTESPSSVLRVLARNKSEFINGVLAVTSIPLIVAVISTICTVWTLKRHWQKMKGSKATQDSERLMAYLRVVCRMSNLLMFYGVFYALVLVFFFSVVDRMKSGLWITLLLMSSFTPVQSVLLIFSNPRLQGAWKKMICYDTFFRFLCGSNKG